jgi:Dyp-type peroxidase family
MTPNATQNSIWSCMQRGLIYPSPHAIFAIFFRRAGLTKAVLTDLLQELRKLVHKELSSAHTSAIAGVALPLWREWSGGEAPPGSDFLYPDAQTSAVFRRSNGTLTDSAGDLFFHIKSDNAAHCRQALEFIQRQLDPYCDAARTIAQPAARKMGADGQDPGKVIGCRFSETLNNATDPLSIQDNVLIDDGSAHRGGSYVFTQRFHLNWDHILNMTPEQIEDLVGRTTRDVLIPSRDTRSHIKCSRVQDDAGDTMQILRLSLPFGQSPAIQNDDLLAKGASLRDEDGIFFAAYAKSVQMFEKILDSQIGRAAGLMRDRVLAEVHADAGGFFYVPSREDLGLELEDMPKASADVRRYPGIDWTLLDRHFNKRSNNGLMFYNHKDYLYVMQTATGDDRKRLDPPSQRVLTLLANAFSRWQDNWYFDRKQQELQHLCAYVARKYGPEKAREVMSLSVAERMGWTIKVSLGDVFASHEYGFRGRRQDANGNWINGADTYRIHPQELIVGALPNIGLGQGRYVIDYARKDEQIPNFFIGLSYASGVGHTVPMFQRALDKGIGGMLAEVEQLRDAATEPGKREFYAGVALALEGVRDHCLAYARARWACRRSTRA